MKFTVNITQTRIRTIAESRIITKTVSAKDEDACSEKVDTLIEEFTDCQDMEDEIPDGWEAQDDWSVDESDVEYEFEVDAIEE